MLFRLWRLQVVSCGSNMDAKKKLFCMLLFRAFKHVDSHIQYLSDKEAQKKRYNDLINVSYNRLQMSSMFQHHMISTWQLLRLSKLTWEGIHVNFQSWKNIIIIPTALERTVMLFYWKNKSQRGQQISVQLNQLQDQQITGHLDFYKVRFLKSSHCWYCLWIWWSKWRVQVTDFMNIS